MTDMQTLKEYTKKMHVLYVEDDPLIQEEINNFLLRLFPVVDLAMNGEEGLECYKNSHYDLVISDINMPKMNGIDMSKAILENDPDQPIVIISAYNEADYLLQLINTGIQYYVLKPVNMKQLLKVINKIAESNHNRQIAEAYQKKLKKDNVKLEKKIEQKAEKLKEQHYIDSLTKLYNRRRLMQDLKEIAEEQKHFVVIILIDIDKLQYINDLHGTGSGDQALIQFTAFLQYFTKNRSYKLYHTSGDQFVLMDDVPYIDTDKYEEDLQQFREKVKNLKVHLPSAGTQIDIDVTVGMSLGQEQPFEHADMALKHAKECKKHFSVYNTMIDSKEKMKHAISWKEKIKEAIENDHVIPVFQPIVDHTGDIVKYESLMRIIDVHSDNNKLISPLFFLDTAIVTKQYAALSETLINKVLDKLTCCDHTLSLNLAFEDINNKPFQQALLNSIKIKGIGKRIIFEITESEAIEDYNIFKNFIKRSRELGIRIAIDDFGSGYSNFQYILEMLPDYIKIDGSLIKNIDTDPQAMVLTKAITLFSHELGIKVIAEYVHSEIIYNILRSFGVDEFQGYHFSEPKENI